MSEQAASPLNNSIESKPGGPIVQDKVANAQLGEEKDCLDKKIDSASEGTVVGSAKLQGADNEDGKSDAGVNKEGDRAVEGAGNDVEGSKSESEAKAGENGESSKRKADDSNPGGRLSKAEKRQKRWEYQVAMKKRKRDHQKESKRAKAIAEGRDLEAEKMDVIERTKSGEGHAKREKVSEEEGTNDMYMFAA
jgi:hypothetical protein